MPTRNKYTPDHIQRARRVPLKPLLKTLGYRLQPLHDDNWKAHGLPKEIIIKNHYWTSPDDGTGGNAIDLLTHVIGKPFNEAMTLLEDFM